MAYPPARQQDFAWRIHAGAAVQSTKKIRPGVQKWNGGRLQMLCVQYQHYNYDVIAKNLL